MKSKLSFLQRMLIFRDGFKTCGLVFFLLFLTFISLSADRPIFNYTFLFILILTSIFSGLVAIFLYSRFTEEKTLKRLFHIEILLDVALISVILHFFTGITGPLFVLYLMVILGSAFGLSPKLPILAGIETVLFVLLAEFFNLVTGQVTISWMSISVEMLQISSIAVIALCGYILAKSILTEQEKRIEAETLASSLEKSEKKVREQLTELNQRHRFVSLMRRLDQIIMNTLDLQEMAQKIVDTISWELGFAGGIIGVLSEKGDTLNFLAISQTPEVKKLLSTWDKPFSSLNLPLADPHYNLCQKTLEQRRSLTTNSLADIFHQVLPLGKVKELQKVLGVESALLYPLSAKGKEIGVLVFLLHEPYANLTAKEVEILDAFTDQAGIAMENALLVYQTKEAHEELQKSYAKLKELDRMKDELVSISSHELRTPMTSVKSYLWMALNKANNLTPKLKRYLERAYVSADRMIKLVEDMLSVSRIDAGRVQLTIKPIDLPYLISQIVAELTVRAEEKKIELSFKKTSKQLPRVLADPDKIREVLTNLLDNALKFTPEKGEITVSLRRRGKMVETSITDTGPGIPKEDLPKLFQKFGRLEHSFATMAESGGGTGLGLYIVKNIISLHRGKVWAKSQIGKGSTFTFSLRSTE